MLNISALFVALIIWLGATPAIAAISGDTVAVRVNGEALTEADLQDVMERVLPYGTFHGGMSAEKRLEYRPKALDLLIEDELLYQEAKKIKLKADRAAVKAAEEQTVKRLGGKDIFNDTLKRMNLSIKQYRKKLERKMLINLIVEKEINNLSIVSDGEAKDYYEQNKGKYVMPPSRRLWHVLISVDPSADIEVRNAKKKRAEEVLDKAISGADLSKLAWDYSDDPYKVKGGDLGYVHEGRIQGEADDAAFSLELGQFSGVVSSIYGYHIMKVIDIKDSVQLQYSDVEQKIKKQLNSTKMNINKEQLLNRLKSKSKIEVIQ